MNKRQSKKADRRKRDKIHRLLDLALDINGGVRSCSREKTGDQPTAFFEYYGHVNVISVNVAKHGWADKVKEIDYKFYLDGILCSEKEHRRMIQEMQTLIPDGRK